jgi:hypothetical protein
MKLIMTLLIRDEDDILRENLLYHLNQGIDFFIVTDNLSVDNSPDILREFEKQGVLYLINEKNDTYEQAKWVTRMARLAKSKFNADWVINSDADEFWWPKDEGIKNALGRIPEKYGIVSVPRYNFIPQIDNVKQNLMFMVIRHVQSKNSLGLPLPSKICHRGLEDVEVQQGNHGILYPADLKVLPESPLEIFHFPLRTYVQFENKIVKGGAAYERNAILPTEVGGTWRKLYGEWKEGKLMDYFNRETLTDEDINRGILEKTLMADNRLRDYLHSRKII